MFCGGTGYVVTCLRDAYVIHHFVDALVEAFPHLNYALRSNLDALAYTTSADQLRSLIMATCLSSD
eukprot:3381679-Amphidinium_carterae.1